MPTYAECTVKNPKEVFELLHTRATGLTEKEAAGRLEKYGFNEIAAKGVDIWSIIVRQCKSPFFYLLFFAGAVALAIGEKIDSVVILLFVAANIIIGFIQEFRAERAISLLKNLIPQRAVVVRGGKEALIPKKFLVPGDVVLLQAGDIVSAEVRVTEDCNLLADESALTGESLPAAKTSAALAKTQNAIHKNKNMLFAGTFIVSGNGRGVVVGTGKNTELGSIATLVASQNHHQSSYEKNLLYFCRLILKIVVATIVVIFLLNLLIKGSGNIFAFSLFCIALIVSILPEALPAIVVLALSRGSLKMAKDHVVVKRLSAIEDLGNLEILCADKTGTLTQNKLSLEKIIATDNDMALLYALLGRDGDHRGVNPFDIAFFERANQSVRANLKKFTVTPGLSFDSFRMRASYRAAGGQKGPVIIVRGAPEKILKLCVKFPKGFDKKGIQEDIKNAGHDGKRVMMVAYKQVSQSIGDTFKEKDERGLTFLGYFLFEDPLKASAQDAVRLAKKLGIQVKIITGDSKEVAGYVAKKVGLLGNHEEVVLGEELESMTADEFDHACREAAVFARVSPKIKYNIIKSLQKSHEVGFLGEGINDAPALKISDVGIVVAEASDISREAADVVLLEKDLRVIIGGIKNGRVIYANINKYIKLTLASNFGNFYSIATISLFINFLPMLPAQILLTNLLSDFPLISVAADSVDIEELRKPKLYQLHMVLPLIISLALVSTVFDFIFFTIFHNLPAAQLQTLWFIESILSEIGLIFIIRTRHAMWKAKKPGFWLWAFALLDGVFIIALPFLPIGQTLFHFVSPAVLNLLIVGFLLILYLVFSEVVKLVYFHYFKFPKNRVQ